MHQLSDGNRGQAELHRAMSGEEGFDKVRDRLLLPFGSDHSAGVRH
ncbi:MAG TPA: hypothetical protein VNH18_27115 [Bryobacteraceae bacterium]|nr:hypothetical protein [Bryobacteraceae bacterium]